MFPWRTSISIMGAIAYLMAPACVWVCGCVVIDPFSSYLRRTRPATWRHEARRGAARGARSSFLGYRLHIVVLLTPDPPKSPRARARAPGRKTAHSQGGSTVWLTPIGIGRVVWTDLLARQWRTLARLTVTRPRSSPRSSKRPLPLKLSIWLDMDLQLCNIWSPAA